MLDKQKLTTLSDILFLAKVHYRLWEELMKRLDEVSVQLVESGYATFFEYTRAAHFKAFVVELHKLIETRKDTYNLSLIFQNVADLENCSGDLFDEISEYKSETGITKRGIFIVRNEVEAHSSLGSTPETSFSKASISSQDIDDFIMKTGVILNRIGSHYFQEQWALNEISEAESIEKLFKAISHYQST